MEPMSTTFQPSLFGGGEPAPDGSFATLCRHPLDDRSWVDHAPGWLAGADGLFEDLVDNAPWGQRERWMYDKQVVEPRLTCSWPVGEAPDFVVEMGRLLSARYRVELDSVWCNYYRDGRDSVAWHGDTVRKRLERPLVAIVSLGSGRRFGLRPRGGGTGRYLTVDGGDLLVMGGRCQHEWEHTVPKSVHGGPRISVTYRHSAE